MPFLSPIYLLLLLVVAALLVVYVVLQRRRQKYAARFSNVALLGSVAPRRPGWRRHLTFALLLAGLAVLSVGVAQPTAAVRVPTDRATVILAIDVSASMKATDVLPSRIAAARTAARSFADLLPSKVNLGLVSFAGTASLVVPPTTNRAQVKAGVSALRLAPSTAIGDGILASLQAISTFGRESTTAGNAPPPARIVLLSDGSNTVGSTVSDAVSAARSAHVPVSTIAFGTPNGTVQIQAPDGQLEDVPVPADTTTLHAIATDTGGSYHTATSEQELRDVYKDIGSQIGYTTQRHVISWRFTLLGLLFLFGAGGAAMLWSGRLA